MNILQKANEKSTLQKALQPISVNPFIYEYGLSITNGIKNSCYVYPDSQNSPTYGDIITFKIPKYGHLCRAIIESTLTTEGDNSDYQNLTGELLFEWIDFQTVRGSKTIQRTSSEYIMLRGDCLDETTRNRMNILLQPDPTFNNTTSVVYTPFYGFFSDHVGKFLDTENCEDLQLVAKIAKDYTTMGFEADITNMSFRLALTYYTITPSSTEQIQRPISYLNVAEFYETPTTIVETSTSANIILETDKSVFATHFLLKNTDQDIFEINAIKIKVDGKTFYDTTKRLALIDYGWYSNSYKDIDPSKPASNVGDRFFSIYWGLFPDRNHNTLCINFKDLGAVECSLSFDALDDDYELYVIHEYFTFLDLDINGEFNCDLIN